eukprot:225580-Amphidinium_carterae.1
MAMIMLNHTKGPMHSVYSQLACHCDDPCGSKMAHGAFQISLDLLLSALYSLGWGLAILSSNRESHEGGKYKRPTCFGAL